MIKQRKKRDLLKFFIFLIIMVCPFIANAQNASEKTTDVQSPADTTKSETLQKNVSYEEFVLETIRIEAIIEKPSVARTFG